jgi:hypothetical protein
MTGAHLCEVEPRPASDHPPPAREELRIWLVKAWEGPVLREAVASASPSLALRADRIANGRDVPARQVLSVAVAVAPYQLRAAGLPTPFGLFADVAGARFGDSALARFGEEHRAAARVRRGVAAAVH